MSKKIKNPKRIYENSRRKCIKEFENTLTNFHTNIQTINGLLNRAEINFLRLENDKYSRKEIAKELEIIYNRLLSIFTDCHNIYVDDFGICIDQLTHTK